MCSQEYRPYRFIDEFNRSKTPVVPLISPVAAAHDKYGQHGKRIVYFDPKTHGLGSIYNEQFAMEIDAALTDFDYGVSSGILVGIVRESGPKKLEPWSGQSLEDLEHRARSLYRGILHIVNDRDGLPVVKSRFDAAVGDLMPGISRKLNGLNPVEIRKRSRKIDSIQQRIVNIVGGFGLTIAQDDRISAGTAPLNGQFLGNEKQEARMRAMQNKLH